MTYPTKNYSVEDFFRTYDYNRPRSIYQYSNMAPRLSAILKRDLDTKKTTPNIEVCPESLGAMLEF